MAVPWQHLTDEERDEAVDAMDKCLRRRVTRNAQVLYFFRKYAKERDREGRRALNVHQAAAMVRDLSTNFDLPGFVFGDLRQTFINFDFSGDELLNLTEARAMVKKTLLQRRFALAGPGQAEEKVPISTLEDGGYTVDRELGRGGQGIMYLASKEFEKSSSWFDPLGFCCCDSGAEPSYCIKFFDKKNTNAGGLQEILDEFNRMKEFQSKFVARTYEAFQDQDFYYLVNEPYFGGDFTKLAKKAHDSDVAMTEAWWRGIFRQCLQGVEYLHTEAQMHCDIKEPNIMIRHDDDFSKPQVVLIDFGLAQGMAARAAGVSGTPGYIPPETWAHSLWQPKGDIFSLGVVFFQLMAARVPAQGGTKMLGIFQEGATSLQDFPRIAEQVQPPWRQFPTYMRQLTDLVAVMLSKDPSARPRAAQALKHSWFSSSSNAELPKATLATLISGSASAFCQAKLRQALVRMCNLCSLRAILRYLDNVARANAAYAGCVPSSILRGVLVDSGVEEEVVDDYISCEQRPGNVVPYADVVQDAVKMKEEYSHQLITNLFNEMDPDGCGSLSLEEVEEILRSDAFDCTFESLEAVMRRMARNWEGKVDFEEFKRAVLEDGRIAPKDRVDRGVKPTRRRDRLRALFCPHSLNVVSDSSSEEESSSMRQLSGYE
eukprot:TRINITY_DN90792_c0_g1_i1.p1 TRINITY_DN90792_c0_g1~~TRINITY_DN90792_c0_g1_i1.p1  ORF type:complete len:664 (-),score=129.07 TRINITY_DN90792_c0_g1_i1:210-2180(-)